MKGWLQMTKILHVISTLANQGPVNQLYNLIKNIDKEKFEVQILTLSPEENDSRIQEFLEIGIKVTSLNIPKRKIFPFRKKFVNKIREINPNIVHSHCFRTDYFNSKMNSYKDIITFSTIHSYFLDELILEYGKIKGLFLANFHFSLIKNIDYPVACSLTIKKMLKNKHNLDVYAIQNSADEEKFNCEEKKSKSFYREKLNLEKEKIIYVYVGNLIKIKNVSYLIKAFNALDEKFQLLVLGDGDLKNELMKEASKNIVFLGRKTNVQEYLCASDVFISSSLSEGMPTAVLEAMACGLPLLLSDIPQHQEIIDKNPFVGDLFSLNDSEDLLQKINVYSSKDIIKEKSKASVDTFNKNFTSKRMTDEYITLYEKALKKANFI